MSKVELVLEYGDILLTEDGFSFRYIEAYCGGAYDAIAEEVDEYDPCNPSNGSIYAVHSHGPYWYVDLTAVEIIKADDPRLFIGMHI